MNANSFRLTFWLGHRHTMKMLIRLRKRGQTRPLAISIFYFFPLRCGVSGRGTESCLVIKLVIDTSQCPVRRFLPATSVPLQSPSRLLPTDRQSCVPHRHARCASFGPQKRFGVLRPCRFPRVARGEPVSANPADEDLRRFSTTSAGSNSPGRLPVYPRWNGAIVGTCLGSGDETGVNYFTSG